MARSHPHSGPVRAGSLSLPGLAMVAMLSMSAQALAQAQTRYSLTTLKPASSAVPLNVTFRNWTIDQSDRVLGSTDYFEGYVWLLSALAFKPRYTQYIARWPATTASTVSPVKAVAASNLLDSASPNGQLVMQVNAPALYDTVAKKALGSLPQANMHGLAVNNAGTVLTTLYSSYTVPLPTGGTGVASFLAPHAHTWSVAQGLVPLPEGGGADSLAWAINASGVIAGQVSMGERNLSQAVVWSGGQMLPIATAPDSVSVAFQINDKGQMLLRRAPIGNCGPGRDTKTRCTVLPDTVYLHDNGVETALMPADATRWISHAVLNNAGVVVGRYRTGTVSQLDFIGATRDDFGSIESSRAFIWQRGVFTDLTDWVKTQGVTLPAGAVLRRALGLNDKGSILAELYLASGASSLVRLTARP